MFKKFLWDETGATAIEYTLIAAMMGALLWTEMPVIESALTAAIGTISGDILSFH